MKKEHQPSRSVSFWEQVHPFKAFALGLLTDRYRFKAHWPWQHSLPRATARSQHQLVPSHTHLPTWQTWELQQGEEIAPKENAGLTLVEEECQGEEQENTSYLHGRGDVFLSTAERKQDPPECPRDPVSGTLLGPLYRSPLLAPQPAPPCSPAVTPFKARGPHQVATGSLEGARMKASPKPMEEIILISSKDWGPGPGVGVSPGPALL